MSQPSFAFCGLRQTVSLFTLYKNKSQSLEMRIRGGGIHRVPNTRQAEHAQDERHRYHCYSYDAIDYEGEEYGACDEYAVEDDSAEQATLIWKAFSQLTATQQRRLRLYASGKTLREIAVIEEASFQSVSESIEAGRKSF